MWLRSFPECKQVTRPPGSLCLVLRMSDLYTQSALHYSPHHWHFQLSRDSWVDPCSHPSHLRPTASTPSPGLQGFRWLHCPQPWGPHASLSPPSRTVVEHGALWAKQLMFWGWNGIRPYSTWCCERYLDFSLHEQFRFYTLSPNAQSMAPFPSQELVPSG